MRSLRPQTLTARLVVTAVVAAASSRLTSATSATAVATRRPVSDEGSRRGTAQPAGLRT